MSCVRVCCRVIAVTSFLISPVVTPSTVLSSSCALCYLKVMLLFCRVRRGHVLSVLFCYACLSVFRVFAQVFLGGWEAVRNFFFLILFSRLVSETINTSPNRQTTNITNLESFWPDRRLLFIAFLILLLRRVALAFCVVELNITDENQGGSCQCLGTCDQGHLSWETFPSM